MSINKHTFISGSRDFITEVDTPGVVAKAALMHRAPHRASESRKDVSPNIDSGVIIYHAVPVELLFISWVDERADQQRTT